MAYSYAQIVAEIDAHMRQCGGRASDWYVGIAANAEDALFSRHQVHRQRDSWIFRQAPSDAIARQVEKAYLDAGHDGGPGGGDASTTFVYAYFKTSTTNP